MGHAFGDLISQHLHRKHGLSQSKLAEGILQAPTVITGMCHGRRLAGAQARERVVAIIGWLHAQGALATQDEANALLAAAEMLPLKTGDPGEAELLHALAKPSRNGSAPASSIQAPTRPAPRHNLPAQLTRFIGREAQVRQLVELVQATRLLTLTGSGGVGKTRLALEVGAQVAERFIDGVWLVDFAPLADPALIAQSVAQVFRLPEQPGHTYLETVLNYLESKRALLIFDNCEHLIDACAGLAETLLRTCAQLHLLVTSREVLRVAGEATWRVPSLTRPPLDPAAPSSKYAPTFEDLSGYESVRLFLARVTAYQTGLPSTATALLAIAQICSQLDGIPLALEMAAARMPAMTAEEIAAQLTGALGDRFRLLTSGTRTAPLRQRTLLTTLEWSYALLLPAEQHLLARLAVFAGGWTADAASSVCSDREDSDLSPDAVLPALLALVQKSFVIAEPRNGQTRYRMLETIRQYAAGKLAAFGEENAVRDRHLRYYIALAEEPPLEWQTWPSMKAKVRELEIEPNNLRAALWRAREYPDHGEQLLRLAGAIYLYLILCDYDSEVRYWLEEALSRGGAAPVAFRARAVMELANSYWHVDTQRMAALAAQSLSLCEEAGDRYGIAYSLLMLGEYARRQDNVEEAQALFEQSLEIGEEAGATCFWCYAGVSLARILTQRGEHKRAAAAYEVVIEKSRAWRDPDLLICGLEGLSNFDLRRALTLCEQELVQADYTHDPEVEAVMLEHYACLLMEADDLVQARQLLEKVETFWRRWMSENRGQSKAWRLADALFDLGRIAWLQDDLPHAAACYAECLQLVREGDDNAWVTRLLIQAGYVALAQGEIVKAAEFFRVAMELWRLAGGSGALPPILVGLAELAYRQSAMPFAAQLYGAAARHSDTLWMYLPSEHVGYDRLVAAARTHLDDPAFAAAWAEGEALTLEQVVALALSISQTPGVAVTAGTPPV